MVRPTYSNGDVQRPDHSIDELMWAKGNVRQMTTMPAATKCRYKIEIPAVFNNKKSEGQITLKRRKEGSIYQRKRDRKRRNEGRKGEREKA